MVYPKNVHLICKVTPNYFYFNELEPYIVTEDCLIPYEALDIEATEDNQIVNNRQLKPHLYNVVPRFNSLDDGSEIPFRCAQCTRQMAFYTFRNTIKAVMCRMFFSIIMHELHRSKTFRKKFMFYFYIRYMFTRNRGINQIISCLLCLRYSQPLHVIIHLHEPKKHILDYKWGRKMQILVNEKCELENAMAWLSTLGGAFSALGDSSIQWAVKAGTISMRQLYIALRLGDPLTICRCKIYLAMSLLQRGYYKKTKQMIRELYKFSVGVEGSKDFRLRNMCLAVWNRLRYVLSQRACKKIKAQ